MHGWPWLAELGTVHRVIDKGKPGKREEVSNFFLTDLAGDMTKICQEFTTVLRGVIACAGHLRHHVIDAKVKNRRDAVSGIFFTKIDSWWCDATKICREFTTFIGWWVPY